MAAYITVGAKTTHGGTVITGSPQTTHNGIPVARKGDKVVCKKCKKVVTIITGDPSYIVDGAPVARVGDMTSCGSKLIASQQAFSESGFDVGNIEPLQSAKSDSKSLLNNIDEDIYDDRFQLLDQHSQFPLAYINYRLDYDGKSVEGTTDEEGFTEAIGADYPAEVSIKILFDEEE
ncbi:PAAR domain-containing protein [Psychrobacter sp. SZ93C1]|uniref:PAAR domain-containing protein n=1 Tax=Psychrobacter sp. SZ93C1 TaxID=2792058 RepID=UPI0018CF4A17|nr:PAAR domain-containing protein [Psychrobacter sp. SZ93C1]MBH0063869.1 PAAR domain-containing protein [Psychrobacter sp. SZ93C1]